MRPRPLIDDGWTENISRTLSTSNARLNGVAQNMRVILTWISLVSVICLQAMALSYEQYVEKVSEQQQPKVREPPATVKRKCENH